MEPITDHFETISRPVTLALMVRESFETMIGWRRQQALPKSVRWCQGKPKTERLAAGEMAWNVGDLTGIGLNQE